MSTNEQAREAGEKYCDVNNIQADPEREATVDDFVAGAKWQASQAGSGELDKDAVISKIYSDLVNETRLTQKLESEIASLKANTGMKWVSVEKNGYPGYIHATDQYYLIYFERDGRPMIEFGYLCGNELFKGTSERYPYPTHYMNLPKPPSESTTSLSIAEGNSLNISPERAQYLLNVRDALVYNDIDEAYHFLGKFYNPPMDKYSDEVWIDIEALAATENHEKYVPKSSTPIDPPKPSYQGWTEKPASELPTNDNWYTVFFGSEIPVIMWFDTENGWDDSDYKKDLVITSWLQPPREYKSKSFLNK